MHGLMRVARGTVVGAAILGIAMLGHTVSGGAMHLWSWTFAALAVSAVGLSLFLSVREWTMPRLLIVLAGAQVVIHYGLEIGAQHGSMPGMATSGGMANMPMQHVSAYSGTTMFFGHVVAIALTAIVLRHGEVWLLSLLDLLGRALHLSLDVIAVPISSAVSLPRVYGVLPVRRTNDLENFVVRRGPPVTLRTLAGLAA